MRKQYGSFDERSEEKRDRSCARSKEEIERYKQALQSENKKKIAAFRRKCSKIEPHCQEYYDLKKEYDSFESDD